MNQICIGTGPGGQNLYLDLDRLVETRLQMTASSGGGKSFGLRTVVEAACGHTQVIILDDEGEFATLRPKYDFIILGRDGDIGFNPAFGAAYALAFLESGKDAVIDLSELELQQKQVFVRDFCTAMVDAPRSLWHDVLVVLDESHEYAPEKNPAVSSKAVARLASKGRKRGFGLLLATQRPAKLAKDVSAECQNKIIGLQNLPDDRRRGADELGFGSREEAMGLRDLNPGQFYACGPAFLLGKERLKGVEVITLNMPRTRPPKRGAGRVAVPKAGTVLKAALLRLEALPREVIQESRDIATLSQQVKDLQRQLETERRQAKPIFTERGGPTEAEVGARIQTALDQQSRRIEAEIRGLLPAARTGLAALGKFADSLGALTFYTKPAPLLASAILPNRKPAAPAPDVRNIMTPSTRPVLTPLRPAGTNADHHESQAGLGLCERRIVTYLYRHQGIAVSKARLAVATGYAAAGGGFNNAGGRLKRLGIIRVAGDNLELAAGTPAMDDLPNWLTDDVFTTAAWLQKLGKCERAVLQHLLDNWNLKLTKEALAAATGYDVGGGGFNNALGKLATLNLISRDKNGISLSEEASNA